MGSSCEEIVVCDIEGGSYSTIDIYGKFSTRMKKLYDHWNDNNNASIWGNSDVLVVETTSSSNNLRLSKSSALHDWLFGLEFPNITIVFGKQQIYYLCSTEDADYFEVLKDPTIESARVQTKIGIKGTDKYNNSKLKKIFHTIHQSPTYCGSSIITIGHIKDELVGSFLKWQSDDSFSGNLVDISDGFSDLLSVKTKLECANVEMSSKLNSVVMDSCVSKILEDTIKDEKEVPHSELSKMIEHDILYPPKEIRVKVKHLKLEKIHLCHPPTIQSGSDFDLIYFAKNTNNSLCYGFENVILCGIGSSYDSCCSYLARTFLFNPCEVQLKAYRVLLKAQKAAMGALKPGHKLKEAYESALSVVEKEYGELVEYMTETVGAGIGLEFTETYLSLNSTNELLVKEGMAFKVVIGLDSVSSTSGKMFSMVLGDTVVIDENGEICVLTKSKKELVDVECVFEYESD